MTAYVTTTVADTYNTTPAWTALTIPEKEAALDWGRRYIDIHYGCSVFNEDDAPVTVQEANSILGQEHLTKPLYNQAPTSTTIKESEVGASGVKSKKVYNSGKKTVSDPFPLVTMLMAGICDLNVNNPKAVFLSRA